MLMSLSSSQTTAGRCNAQDLPDRRSRPGAPGEKDEGVCRNAWRQAAAVFPAALPPDRNPDELVWKHLKADTVGRMVVTDKADFKSKVVSAMRSLQRNPGKICSSSKPSMHYAG